MWTRVLACTRLLLRLRPGADARHLSADIACRSVRIGGRPDSVPVRTYTPLRRRALGGFILVHGMTPWGPEDPRMDRFAKALAGAGFFVAVPTLRAFVRIRLRPSLLDDLRSAVEHYCELEGRPDALRPALFSISLGALPALRLAACPDASRHLCGLICFGGCADLRAALRYAAGLERTASAPPADPLVLPAIALNLAGDSTQPIASAVRSAWERYVGETWNRDEMKSRSRSRELALELAQSLPPQDRATFLTGCGLSADTPQFFESGLRAPSGSTTAESRAESRPPQDTTPQGTRTLLQERTHAQRPETPHGRSVLQDWEIGPELARIQLPVRLIHGLDDPIIPHSELEALRTALPPEGDVRCFSTGLFRHSGARSNAGALAASGTSSPSEMLCSVRTGIHELRTLLGMSRAIVELAAGG